MSESLGPSSSSDDEMMNELYSWLVSGQTGRLDLAANRRKSIDTFRVIVNRIIDMLCDVDEAKTSEPRRRGSAVIRDREGAHDRLFEDYFAENSNCNEEIFRRQFRMSKRLFQQILEDLEWDDTFFQQSFEARGRKGLSPLQKCTSTIRQMAYGTSVDSFDEYLKMAESTARLCLQKFSKCIIKLYGTRYLRKLTFDDIQQLYATRESKHGFPSMLGSLDCMHWDWANCPTGWRGQIMRGDHDRPTIVLEAVASQDLWVWHAFFGVAGSNNDINVLNQSPLLDDVYNGKSAECSFEVNGITHKHSYYLTDGIYSD